MRFALLVLLVFVSQTAQCKKDFLVNGVPWYDQRDSLVSAHGANIIYDNGRYYMFGEYKTDSANVFVGFSCYSSEDLVHWRFERIAFPTQLSGRLGQDRVGERPKVLRCPSSGEYVMIAHSDNRSYKDPCVIYATSPTINGEYTYRGPLLYKGEPIKRWDIGSFADDDGHAYLLVHHGSIYRFSEDFHSLDSCMTTGQDGVGESPAMFKKDGIYYWLSSHTTSWERNDNMYHVSRSLAGPWEDKGNFCPKDSLTYNSQTSFVLPIVNGKDTTYMFMGDRWSFPKQHSAATYVWLPLQANKGRLSIPEYLETWNPVTASPCNPTAVSAGQKWVSNKPGDILRLNFQGKEVGVVGTLGPDCGYAQITIKDKDDHVITEQIIDFYAKTSTKGLRFVSRELPFGNYVIEISVTGFSPTWTDKKRRIYGSTDTYVRIDDILTM